MFNLFIYNKKNQKESTNRSRTCSSLSRQKLVLNYNRRVNAFLNQMAAEPFCIPQYTDTERKQFKRMDQVNSSGRQAFRFSMPRTQIQSNMINSQPLNAKPHQFRQRNLNKQIQPAFMRFKNINSLQRIRDKVKSSFMQATPVKRRQEVLPEIMSQQKCSQILKDLNATQKKILISREIAKSLYPFLHKKTHFKALSHINLPKFHSRPLQSKKDLFLQQIEMQKLTKRKQQMSAQEEDQLKESSVRVLKQCGIIRIKKGH